MTFAVVPDFVTVHSFVTLNNFRDRLTVNFVKAPYFCDCFLHFRMAASYILGGREGGRGHVEKAGRDMFWHEGWGKHIMSKTHDTLRKKDDCFVC